LKIKEKKEGEADEIHEKDNPVIIAGFGRFGQIIGRFLEINHIRTTVLDHDPSHVEMVRRFGRKVFYGDASRVELLRSAGAEQAKLIIVAIDHKEQAVELVKHIKNHFPNVKILARAIDRPHAFELLQLGVDSVHRETFSSSLDLGVNALQMLGFRAHHAHRLGRNFKHYDEEAIKKTYQLWGKDEKVYMQGIKQYLNDVEKLLQADRQEIDLDTDPSWNSNLPRKDA